MLIKIGDRIINTKGQIISICFTREEAKALRNMPEGSKFFTVGDGFDRKALDNFVELFKRQLKQLRGPRKSVVPGERGNCD